MEAETAENLSICCLTGFPTRKSGVRSWSTIPRSCFRSTGRWHRTANAAGQARGNATIPNSEEVTMQLDHWTPKALGVVRIMASLLFIEHGTQKLLGFPSPVHGISPLFSFMGFAGSLELVGGVLLLLAL